MTIASTWSRNRGPLTLSYFRFLIDYRLLLDTGSPLTIWLPGGPQGLDMLGGHIRFMTMPFPKSYLENGFKLLGLWVDAIVGMNVLREFAWEVDRAAGTVQATTVSHEERQAYLESIRRVTTRKHSKVVVRRLYLVGNARDRVRDLLRGLNVIHEPSGYGALWHVGLTSRVKSLRDPDGKPPALPGDHYFQRDLSPPYMPSTQVTTTTPSTTQK